MPIDITAILAELDTEIARLQQIRSALTGSAIEPAKATGGKKRGRPKGSKNSAGTAATADVPKKRTMSPEARQRIADAQKKRWADQKPDPTPAPTAEEADSPA